MFWAAFLGLTAFQSPPQTGTFVGRVVDADTGEAIAHATVKLTPAGAGRERPLFGPRGSDGRTLPFPNQPPRPQTTSDANGNFRLPAAPGDYQPSFELVGYVIDYQSVERAGMITINAQQTLPSLTVKLRKQAVITGRVLDQEGKPIANALVSALTPPRTFQSIRLEASNEVSSQTNALGEYRLAGLQPGKYLVSAGSALFPGRDAAHSYATVYYPGVAKISAAHSLEVAAGATRSAIDFRLPRIALVNVSGKVSPFGTELVLRLEPDESAQGLPMFFPPQLNDNGEFTFQRIPPGDYSLSASLFESIQPNQLSRPTRSARLRLKVGDRDVTALALNLTSPTTLHGRVVASKPASLAGIGIVFQPQSRRDPFPGNTRADAEGRFSFSNLDPVTYRPVAFDLPKGYYVKAMTSGKTEVKDTLNLQDGGTAELTIVLDNGTAQLSGRVVNQKKQPAAGTFVLLMDANQEVYAAQANGQGEYIFEDLAPGEYRLSTSATPNVFDPAVQAQLTQRGQKITLARSAKETRHLEVK